MNKSSKQLTVKECKIQASILLKFLYSKIPAQIEKATKRFQQLPEFSKLSSTEIIQAKIKRKHALAAVAMGKGFKSWADLKCQILFIRGGFLNQWFAHYPEAKSYLQEKGGFLLPYKNQFFICDAHYITQLGLDADDHDWVLIGYDWENPNDQAAWQRLYQKWMNIQESK